MPAMAADNRLALEAVVLQRESMRYTPAGIPALNLVLEHSSEQTECGTPRQVKLELKALTFGTLAETLVKQPMGKRFGFEGFLCQSRNGKGVVFHIQAFTPR